MPRRLAAVPFSLLVVCPTVAATRPLAPPDVAPRIDHVPITCVVAGSYPWVEVRVTPEAVGDARVLFRSTGSDDWYKVRLTPRDGRWAGSLPAPREDLDTFSYVVEVTNAEAHRTRTAEHTVKVVPAADDCGTDRPGPSVADALPIVEAPDGGTGVPRGFGDEGDGTDAAEDTGGGDPGTSKVGVFGLGSTTSFLAGLGLTAAAVAVGISQSGSSNESPSEGIDFLGSDPGTGSQISIAHFSLALRFHIESDEDVGSGSVLVGLETGGPSCLEMWVPHQGIRSGQPINVTVDRLLVVTCAPPFSVSQGRVVVRGPGETDLFSAVFRMPFTFVP